MGYVFLSITLACIALTELHLAGIHTCLFGFTAWLIHRQKRKVTPAICAIYILYLINLGRTSECALLRLLTGTHGMFDQSVLQRMLTEDLSLTHRAQRTTLSTILPDLSTYSTSKYPRQLEEILDG